MTCFQAGIDLHRRPRRGTRPCSAIDGEELREPVGAQAVPAVASGDRARAATTRTCSSVTTRLASHARARSATVGPGPSAFGRLGPVEQREHSSSTVPDAADAPRAHRRFVGRDDPGAHRDVAAGQAGHVAPAAGREAAARRPVSGAASPATPGDGLHERRGDDERQVADRRHRPVVRAAASGSTRAPASRRQPLHPARSARGVALGTTTHGRSRTGRRRPRRSRSSRGPAIGCPPTNRSPSAVARSTMIAALVLATSVIVTPSGEATRARRPSQRHELEDSSAGAARTTRSAPVDGLLGRRRDLVDGAVRQAPPRGPRRAASRRRRGASGGPASRAADGSADQPQAEERDPHRRIIARARCRRLPAGCRESSTGAPDTRC